MELYNNLKRSATIYNPWHTEAFICSVVLFTVAVCLSSISVFYVQHMNSIHCPALVLSSSEYLSGKIEFGSNIVHYRFGYSLPDKVTALRIVGPLTYNGMPESALTLCGGDKSCHTIETLTCEGEALGPACNVLAASIKQLDSGDTPVEERGKLSDTTALIKDKIDRFLLEIITEGADYAIALGPMCVHGV